jgi:hypothetical protein
MHAARFKLGAPRVCPRLSLVCWCLERHPEQEIILPPSPYLKGGALFSEAAGRRTIQEENPCTFSLVIGAPTTFEGLMLTANK